MGDLVDNSCKACGQFDGLCGCTDEERSLASKQKEYKPLFNAEGARMMVAEFNFKEEKDARAQVPLILTKIETAARRGQSMIMLDIKYKYVKIVIEELKALGFSVKMECQGRDGNDNTYTINW